MAHILIVYKQFPGPAVGHAGGEALFGLMKALHRRGHRLSLVARLGDETTEQQRAVAAICERVITTPHHRVLRGPKPLAVLRSYGRLRRAARRALRELRPDALHVETTQTALILVGMRKPRSSFRTQDVNWFLYVQRAQRSRGLRRQIARLQVVAFRLVETALLHGYDVVETVSEGDLRLLQTHRSPLLLLPLVPAIDASHSGEAAVPEGPNVLFVGAMARDHNIAGVLWFLDTIWPLICAQVPEARFFIVGKDPPPEVLARADAQHIVVTGFVDDLAAWYRAAAVFVSPLWVAGGLLQKVLDAMAMGVAVVATPECNHGLGAVPGVHLLLADTPQAFAEAVLTLLLHPEARQRLGKAGQRFVRERYDLVPALDRWEAAWLGPYASDSAGRRTSEADGSPMV